MQNLYPESFSMMWLGPGQTTVQLADAFFKTFEWLMLPPKGEELAERIAWSICQPIREAGTDHSTDTSTRDLPLTAGAGGISKLRVTSLLGVTLWTFGIIKRSLVIHPCHWLHLLNRFSRSQVSPLPLNQPTPRHHHLSAGSYTTFLTAPPASTLGPKHQRSTGGCPFAKLPEKSTVIPMDMGYWDLSVSNSSFKGKEKTNVEMFLFHPNN